MDNASWSPTGKPPPREPVRHETVRRSVTAHCTGCGRTSTEGSGSPRVWAARHASARDHRTVVVETTVIRYGVDLSLSVPTPAKQLQPLGPLGEQIVDRVRYQTERRHTTSPAELAATLGIDRTTASRYLSRLAAAGRVRRVARAEYAAIDPEEL